MKYSEAWNLVITQLTVAFSEEELRNLEAISFLVRRAVPADIGANMAEN